ncbi:MAG: rhomboid family intramembrane serine protease [Bacteroidota bacterium]
MYRVSEVVKHLLIINVLMYVGSHMLNDAGWVDRIMLAMHYPSSPYFQPFQIVTHMFMHGGLAHLFFNMFGVFMFGPPLENLWGPKKFLFYYLATGFGALILHLIVNYIELNFFGVIPVPMLGASGALFGLLVGYGMNYPENRIMLLIPPIPIKAKYFVMIYAGLELFLGFSGANTGIAHFAHLGGALAGLLLILYWRNNRSRF